MHPQRQTAAAPDPAHQSATAANSQDFEDFIYLISHDVRGSVRALLELPQWIAEDLEEAGYPIDGSVAASIEMMNRHAGRLDRMLVDLLTFSRIGRMQEVQKNDLDAALDTVLEEIKLPSGFELVRNLDCKHVTMGERDLLTLLDALIQNSFKHHDRSSGRIVVSAARAAGTVVLSVADDGPGVPEEFREKVFGAMRTLRPRDEVEGSGMGLANVRKIATLHGGGARLADSPYGRGCTVEIRLKDKDANPA